MKIDFEKLFDEKILKRGYNYYLEDAVHNVTRNGNHYEGLVYGTEIYEVQIEIADNGNVEDIVIVLMQKKIIASIWWHFSII